MLQAGVQHLVFSGLIDPRPFKPNLPVDPTSGRQIPHYETKAQIEVIHRYRLASYVPCNTLLESLHILQPWHVIALHCMTRMTGHGIACIAQLFMSLHSLLVIQKVKIWLHNMITTSQCSCLLCTSGCLWVRRLVF